jgi:hypothetical protein
VNWKGAGRVLSKDDKTTVRRHPTTLVSSLSTLRMNGSPPLLVRFIFCSLSEHTHPFTDPGPCCQFLHFSVSSSPLTPSEDLNQINQHDEHYVSLRSRANQEGDQMVRCFNESHEAYARKDGARAKELSNQGKEHKRNMEEFNAQASDWIFASEYRHPCLPRCTTYLTSQKITK